MIQEAAWRYAQVQTILEDDAEYRMLDQQRRGMEAEFYRALDFLTEQQRSAVMAYIGICAEMTERTVEVACFVP